MANDEAENVGGISVSVGASHARLEADLAEANRLLAQWQKQHFNVNLGTTGTPGGGAGRPAAGRSPAVAAIQQETRQIEQAYVAQGNAVRAARRKNIQTRDIGTTVNPNRIYTFDPAVYAEQERQQEAKAARERERLLSQHARRPATTTGPTIRQVADEEKRARDQQLRELSYEAEREGGAGRTSATFAAGGQTRTPAQIQAFREQEARRANAQAARTRPASPTPPIAITAQPPIDAIERQRRALLDELTAGTRGRAGGTAGQIGEEDLARRETQRIATAESSRIAAGRTPRTTAAGFGGQFLFGGPARQQVEATARQAAAEQNLLRIRRLASDPKIIRDARAYRQVIEEQTVAEKTLAAATERVQGLAGAGTAIRSLAAVTVAGAAFGIGLQAVNVGVQAASRALDPYIQQISGFIGLTNETTSALADQARQQQGNVQGAVAAKLAFSGLGAETSRSIEPIIAQRASIEAGNKAITDQIALIRTAQQLQSQGAGAGLGSTTGGLFGSAIFGIPSTGEQIGGLLNQAKVPQITTRANTSGRGPLSITSAQAAPLQSRFAQDLAFVNDQLAKGGDGAAKFGQDVSKLNPQIEQTAQAFDAVSPEMAKAIRDNGLYSQSIRTVDDALRALTAINFAGTLPDISNLRQQALTAEQFRQRASVATLDAIQSQQAFQRPSVIAAAGRQQQYALNVQQPAQAGLQALSQPLQPVGTGILAANAAEQKRITAGQQESIGLQKQLNDYYAQGKQILLDTYKVPPQLIADVEKVGKAIAATQASISNEQAAYQVAQYNFQLQIAKRTLSDIGGLTGKNFGAGESYLGSLERQNLALSRQGQQLQFNLSQRQINFQVALAGFQAPGVTPEERQARIAEAQTEAGYAQKQLDIQRQMFGNQVQIVDISNLRQGADLARQIGLLLQGRKVTIDTQVAEERLLRLQQLQQKQVAQVGTYLQRVDSLAAAAFGEIQQLEAAAGKAMANVATNVLAQFGITIKGINDYLGSVGGSPTQGGAPLSGGAHKHAAGGVYDTLGPTSIGRNGLMGEAGGEKLLILSHPQAANMAGGGTSVTTVNFGDVYVRDESDINKIVREVTKALGREASVKGLRGIG